MLKYFDGTNQNKHGGWNGCTHSKENQIHFCWLLSAWDICVYLREVNLLLLHALHIVVYALTPKINCIAVLWLLQLLKGTLGVNVWICVISETAWTDLDKFSNIRWLCRHHTNKIIRLAELFTRSVDTKDDELVHS